MRDFTYRSFLVFVVLACLWGSYSIAGGKPAVMLGPDELVWADGPPSMPPGARIAVIEGVLNEPVPFIFRLRLPPGYRIPPHSHPAIEHVTIISGTLHFGAGEKIDPIVAKPFPPGSVIVMPAGKAMFAWTADEETVIQVHGTGPWGISYENPEDDPRRK